MVVALVIVGSLGRILLLPYPNVETVMVTALLAGCMLGGIHSILVPFTIMAVTDAYIYGAGAFSTVGLTRILGVTIFTWSGFVMCGLMGRFLKRKVKFSLKFVGKLTGLGMIATLIYQAWVNVGWWYVWYAHTLENLALVFLLALPFTLRQLASSLFLVPSVSAPFLYAYERMVVAEVEQITTVAMAPLQKVRQKGYGR
jgi:hypothetical protein